MSTNYFDKYDANHRRMAELSAEVFRIGFHGVTAEQVIERERLSAEINRLRDEALDLIPYGATTPNKGWNGKRY